MKDLSNFEDRLKIINSFDGNLVYGAKSFNLTTNRTGKGPSNGLPTKELLKVVQDSQKDRFVRKSIGWVEQKNCVVCNSKKRSFLLNRLGLAYFRCAECSHIYQDPILSNSVAAELYSNEETTTKIYKSDNQQEMDEIKFSYGVDLINSFVSNKNRNSILDIGCGPGIFSKVAFRKGWDLSIGVDINDSYDDISKSSSGFKLVRGNVLDIASLDFNTKFDVISMWSFLEHIPDPKKYINDLGNVLKDNGLIFILVPNSDSLVAKLLREKSTCYNWKHISYFNIKSLNFLLESCGYNCVFDETVITEIGNIKSYLNGKEPYSGELPDKDPFSFIDSKFIHINKLGSRIIAVYKKISK